MRTLERTKVGIVTLTACAGIFAVAGVLVATMAVPTSAIGQAIFGPGILSAEVVGGTGGLAVDEDHNKISNPLIAARRNVDATGSACLHVYASTESQTINKMIYNHILVLDNHCLKEIKIRACYYRTDGCQKISAPANKRQRYVFGVFTEKDFRFGYREYVN
jgi:hypothetical protein